MASSLRRLAWPTCSLTRWAFCGSIRRRSRTTSPRTSRYGRRGAWPRCKSPSQQGAPPTQRPPAWRTLPSWYLVSTQDRMINPDLERFMADRISATTVEVRSSHASPVSHPDQVARLILAAAQVDASA
ncbi:MAG: alpha/beta hydrolase [Actinobacteria bacterium]|nr:alpha/beta hydrolase [Actinomycetota bacterium]